MISSRPELAEDEQSNAKNNRFLLISISTINLEDHAIVSRHLLSVFRASTTVSINRSRSRRVNIAIMASITEESPLAEQLKSAVQAKAIEYSWTQDEDDMSLAEYIVLMVANGKNQEQIAAELSGDLLQDATGIDEFTQWLTDYVARLTGAGGVEEVTQDSTMMEEAQIPAAYDNDLGESAPDNAYATYIQCANQVLTSYSPKGPKGLHGGPRAGRGGRNSVQGKGQFDSVLHRTRGGDRINSHTRGTPKGPRGSQSKDSRGGMQKALNGMQNQMQNPMMQAAQQGQFNPMNPQQQMEFMAMMEQQARMLAQFMPGMAQPGMNGSPQNGQNGRSMFDRVDRGRGGMNIRGRGRGGANQNNSRKSSEIAEDGAEAQTSTDTPMDTDNSASKDPATTICYFNLRCLNKECPYAHQSPSAPLGTEIDLTETCQFGAACKNTACHGKHPSPAQIAAHKAEQECRFFPNCTNANCQFKHPSMPLCSFGASCNNKDCKFTHLKTKCKYNPCTNARCPFTHDAGQSRTMSQFTWTKDQAEQPQQPQQQREGEFDHVSNRKFVVEGEEELIKGENPGDVTTGGEEGDVIT